MRLMGVTGKSGAGKTTFSNYLSESSKDIDVIHIDDLLKEIKLKYFKLLMKKDNHGEKVKVDSKLKKFIYKNKIIFSIFMKVRAKLVESLLNQRLSKLQGQRVVLIDDIFIKYHKIYRNLEKIYMLDRPYEDRKTALQQRDGLSKEEIVAYDVAHFTKNYKEIKDDKRITYIFNKGDKEELHQKAKEIYREDMLSEKEKTKQRIKYEIPTNSKVAKREEIPKVEKAVIHRNDQRSEEK